MIVLFILFSAVFQRLIIPTTQNEKTKLALETTNLSHTIKIGDLRNILIVSKSSG